MSNLCAAVTLFYWETIQDEHLHLKNLDLRVPSRPIDLLKGMDHAELLKPSQIRRGNEDEPHGVLTELGWLVRGKKTVIKGERVPQIHFLTVDTFRRPAKEVLGNRKNTEGKEKKPSGICCRKKISKQIR